MTAAAASGRPIRFFALVMAGWVAVRFIYMDHGGVEAADEAKQPTYAHDRPSAPMAETSFPDNAEFREIMSFPPAAFARLPERRRSRPSVLRPPLPAETSTSHAPPSSPFAQAVEAPAEQAAQPSLPSPPPALPLALSSPEAARRWHGSAWLLWRDGSATQADAIAGGRLGGSQAGLRVDFDLTPRARSRSTVYARASAALNQPVSPEAAIGLSWQPARSFPVSLAAERRIALGQGGRNANALMAVGGFGPTNVAPALEIEAYAQSGMVGFRSRDLFVDGKISLLSPVGSAPVRLGASLSGGAQPRVSRLDIGPELQIRLPTAPVASRLAVEWRERVAGAASPSSGLAVTLGAYF
ncbi:hypothetical protein [Sphingobium sp. Sx8-8]|uniref:hypothetical protein n=1 Tax=Sphingobium sp. Sx8-8 TaxID=2933617 RepID=UPI001F58A8C9|nr:hypothetical protein [Sphingobium sp. Sx8-8]